MNRLYLKTSRGLPLLIVVDSARISVCVKVVFREVGTLVGELTGDLTNLISANFSYWGSLGKGPRPRFSFRDRVLSFTKAIGTT